MQRKHLEQEKELNNWRAACLHALQKLFLKGCLVCIKVHGNRELFPYKIHAHDQNSQSLSFIGYPIQVLQIQNSAFSPTHLFQNSGAILFKNTHNDIRYCTTGPNCLGLGFTPTKNTINGNIYILCWQICGNEYKTLRDCMTVLVMDSKMSIVSCSLRKQFIASPQNSHMSTTSSFVPFQHVIKTTYSKPTFANIFKAKSFKFIILQNRT